MAGRIRDEDVKAVRDAIPIDAVVSEYLQLRNAGGGNLKGLCPFHEEKTPSFQVSPSKGLYYCFGCQQGGDTLDFVMKLEHITFAEAVERLAAQAGIALRYEEGGYTPGRQQGERTRLVEAHKVAAAWYAEQLETTPEAEIARAFLADRGFDAAAARHFGLGYAPAGWENLVRYLRGRGFSDKELLLSGLASEGRRGPMDRFRGRLLWPIRDITGEVIGFGARRLRDDDNGPKYLNTPETPIYRKSHVLYGIDLAKKEIAKSGRAVVVEGYTDVMACHLAGVTTAIATCGTAFGEDHIKILRRLLMDSSEFRGEVVYTFDGDAAGQKAALRAFEGDQKFATQTFIAVGPDGMDPCDLRLAKGDAAVRDLVEHRRPLFDFAIRSMVDRYDVETPEGQAAALEAAVPVVARIKDQWVRESYGRQLTSMLGVLDESAVIRRVAQLARWERERRERGAQPPGRAGREQPAPAPRPAARPSPDPADRELQAERELLKLALQRPELVSPAFDAYEVEEFTAPPYAQVRRAVAEAGGTTGADGGFLARVRDAAPDDTVRSLVTELAVEPLQTPREPDALYAGQWLVAVRLRAVRQREAEAHAYLRRLGARVNPEEAGPVQQELWALQQYRRALEDKGAAAL
ncbi:DNA primase [Streptomyces capparidis]